MEERSWWDLWNTSYRSKDAGDPTSGELFAHVVSIVESLNGGRPGRLLEVACGTGTISRRLAFSTYHGLDLSAAAIDIARNKAHEHWPGGSCKATYEAADFHTWSLPGEPVDLLLCVDAIACIRDQSRVVRRMAEMVRSGGYLVMTTVNPIVYNRIRRVGGVRLENGPVSHWLSKGELHGLIAEAGLSVVRSYTIMPRGNMGLLRIINSPRLNEAFGPRFAAILRRAKERAGIGQYRVVIARKA